MRIRCQLAYQLAIIFSRPVDICKQKKKKNCQLDPVNRCKYQIIFIIQNHKPSSQNQNK